MNAFRTKVAIIGAGPAGLTAAYLLAKEKIPAIVLESDPRYIGGICRTVEYKGCGFDIGGHRFFSKSQEVEDFWTEILPNDMLVRPRKSRIYYRGAYFAYPLKPLDALMKLGLLESLLCVLSYGKARLFPISNPRNFEDWVTNQFGARLYRIFFKTYTEKVWGMSCREISADWAAQRIKGLSLSSAIFNAFGGGQRKNLDQMVKSLIHTFRYPRKGPGMIWEACAAKFKAMGGILLQGRRVSGCHYEAGSRLWRVSAKNAEGQLETIEADHVISSAPLRELIQGITPAVSDAARQAAQALRYRDFLVVALILRDKQRFDDNWIYIHEPGVKVGRIQNFKSWSPEMVVDSELCCYGMEYFCFENDGLWNSSDSALIDLAKSELERIGLAKAADVLDGCVVRQRKAYPVYDDHYADYVSQIREELKQRFPTLHLVGRNGMHKYNNQDHAMMTAMLTVKNIVAGQEVYDPWRVNQDAEYHEEHAHTDLAGASGLRSVPSKVGQDLS